MKIKIAIIANLVFVLAFFIYIKKVPLNIETQPIIIFFLSLVFLFSTKIKLTKSTVLVWLHIALISIYAILQFLFFRTGIISYFTFLIGPVVYLLMVDKAKKISLLLIKAVTVFFLFWALVVQFQIPSLIEAVNLVNKIFIGRAENMGVSGLRGVTLLTPEPSYFAFPLILLIYLVDFNKDEKGIKGLQFYRVVLFIIALMTKSALVFFYLIFYLLGRYLGQYDLANIIKWVSPKKIVTAFFLLIVFSLPFVFFKESRPVQVVENVTEGLSKGNMYNVIFSESSGSTRFISNFLGIASIFKAPFGWGLGEFQNNYYDAASVEVKKIIREHEVLRLNYQERRPLKAQTYIANLSGDIGIFILPLLLFLIISFFKAKGKLKGGLKWVLPLMLLLVQGQISNPVVWILLAFMNSSLAIDEKSKIQL